MDILSLPFLVLLIALLRGVVVMDGLAFMFIRKTRDIHWGRSMKIAFAEPFLLLLVCAFLWFYGPIAPMTMGSLSLALLGAACSLFGFTLFIWSFVAYRTVGTGHYVDDDHTVVRSGPYALMRHPMYCAAIFIWLGLALGHADWALLTLTYAYVIPAYYFYARDEEAMMADSLGAEYVDYRKQVPMLFPKPLSIWE